MRKGTDNDKTTPFIRDEGDPVLPSDPILSPAPARRAGAAGPPSMFGAYAEAKNRKMPPWAMPLIAFVVLTHVGFLGVSWASSIWQIERLDRPKGTSLDIAIAPAPPPPPPPPPGGAKPQTQVITPKKKTVKDIVQQVKIEKQETVTSQEDAGDPNGEEGGVEGGVAGGVAGGVITDAPPPPPPPPPPPAPPQNVPPTLLEGSRIAGEKMIVPNDVTKTEISRSGKDKIVGSYKLCLTVDGNISTISQLKSTGFGAYDAKIQAEMRNWRYRPYMVNGRAVPVCTAVTFIYSQK